MSTRSLIERADRVLFPVYARAPLALVRGQGTRVWDADGREYLDFFSSTVVTALGHAHPAVTRAIERQAAAILHVSNLHYSEPQTRLAEMLVDRTFPARVFLCNSGAEANEAAIKLARRYGHAQGGGRHEILTALGSFHGRTLATIAATGQEKVRIGFDPVPPGFRYVPYGDLEAAAKAINEHTVGVLVEPIQGEAGVRVPPEGYLQGLRELCDRHDLLLILDEVQTGIGRTGPLFAYQEAGIVPDVITLAKGLGNGVPIGAMLAREQLAECFGPGAHGSTFGGNALCCAAAVAVLETLDDGVLAEAARTAAYLRERLEKVAAATGRVREIRGRGLLIGIDVDGDAAAIVDHCRERGLILNSTGPATLRIAPPLTVRKDEVDRAAEILHEVLRT